MPTLWFWPDCQKLHVFNFSLRDEEKSEKIQDLPRSKRHVARLELQWSPDGIYPRSQSKPYFCRPALKTYFEFLQIFLNANPQWILHGEYKTCQLNLKKLLIMTTSIAFSFCSLSSLLILSQKRNPTWITNDSLFVLLIFFVFLNCPRRAI